MSIRSLPMIPVRSFVAGAAVAAITCLFVPTAAVYAQGGQLGNSAQLEKDYSQAKPKFFGYVIGKESKIDPRVVDTVAQYLVYRVTWPQMDARLPEALKDFHT